jgi:flagellar biosynthetic protein FliP
MAQQLPIDLLNLPVDGSVAAWIIRTFGLLTILSVAPGILIMVTSFPRFIIAFSILRSGMGLASTPSNMILLSLSLFMTFYVMQPTFDQAWQNGVQPLLCQPDQRAAGRPAHRRTVPHLHDPQHPREGSGAVRRSGA